jgi:ferredoxin
MKRYDERETLFSRLVLKKGTNAYNTFYKKHPELKYEDDQIRGKSFRDGHKSTKLFNALIKPIIKHNKPHIKALYDMVQEYPVNPERVDVPLTFKRNLKEIVKYYGADDVGLTLLNDYKYYEVAGGLSEELGIDNYGQRIVKRYKMAIVFTVPMDKKMINRAPHYEELLATEEGYLKLAHIGARVSMYLKDLGYKADFANSEHYYGPLVPLGHDAGLGQIGMTNHLVTKKHGNRVRLGAVYTTLVLEEDHPIDFGLNAFCKRCALCLMNCPSGAISHKERPVNGRLFYQFDENKCYDMWTKSGTDCGTCIQSCPFTQGIDPDLVEKMKDNPDVIDDIIQAHLDQYGRRAYTKKTLSIVDLKERQDG